MSNICASPTAPININVTDDKNLQKNQCHKKCDYLYYYKESPSVLENDYDSIKLSYDNDTATSAPINYNGNKYTVAEVRIVWPSIHSWNGEFADAEMLIVHRPFPGEVASNLTVCIPFKEQGSTSNPVALSKIINLMKESASQKGNSVNLTSYNLNDYILQNQPYFWYKGTLIFDECDGNNNEYLVFDYTSQDGYKTISSTDFSNLKNIIKQSTLSPVRNTNGASDTLTYYNPYGALKSASNISSTDEIYIDCQPTGDSGETLVETPGVEFYQDFEQYMNKYFPIDLSSSGTFFKTCLAAIIFFIIWKIAGKILSWIGGVTTNASSGNVSNIISTGNTQSIPGVDDSLFKAPESA